MSEPRWQPRSDPAARLLGAGFLLGGAALLALQAHAIHTAIAHHEPATYFVAAIGFGEMGVTIGAYWLVRGLAGYHATRSLREHPRARRALLLVSLVVLGSSLLGLRHWLRAHGYDS